MAKAKKNLLGDFEFKKFENLNNGIEIPVTNSLKVADKPDKKSMMPNSQISKKKTAVSGFVSPSLKSKNIVIDLPDLNYSGKEEIKPLINVVPTSNPVSVVPTSDFKGIKSKPKPKKELIIDADIDLSEYGALESKSEKVLYLAMRGWSLKVEQRRNSLFHYATKYIARKKKRIYLGSVNHK